jgi:1,4-dihydroxy-2-naphthoate octaprenyltransferase
MRIKIWIKAFRLRTLPLALASVLMGSIVALHHHQHSWKVIILAIITTLLLQILSNLANDYGDGMKGTDNEQRLGPKRTVQSGEISPAQMRIGIFVFVILSLISGVWLIIEATGENFAIAIVFLILGIAAIAAAIKYTVGKKAYGYSGLGDLFVFIFFGPVAVLGTSFLATHTFSFADVFPAITLGLLSTGVLNLNNMRDIDNDRKSGKNTIAMKLGLVRAKKYHTWIISIAILSAIVFTIVNFHNVWQFIYIITIPAFARDIYFINHIHNNKELDPFLKKLAFSTLIFTLLFGMGTLLA